MFGFSVIQGVHNIADNVPEEGEFTTGLTRTELRLKKKRECGVKAVGES